MTKGHVEWGVMGKAVWMWKLDEYPKSWSFIQQPIQYKTEVSGNLWSLRRRSANKVGAWDIRFLDLAG